jgi:potassium large conductance calcium-activated channel subfamily M alpha protein 1
MRPIVILSNDIVGDEDGNGDTYVWGEINRFEEIYILKGSALNPADLERARIRKARAIIIIAKGSDSSSTSSRKMLDADAIFMYKTIEANFKNLIIVTELASMSAIAFLVPGNEERYQKLGYFMSKPFASGEIYVSSLLDSLMT